MPKKTLGFCGMIGALYAVMTPATAATCAAGYYLRDGTCVDCDARFYCPGDDTRHSCADETNPTPQRSFTIVNGAWNATNATSYNECTCNWDYEDESRTWYQYERPCRQGPGGQQYHKYMHCRTGYYATNPLWFHEWYSACSPCTNAPAHAHYTSYSTPSKLYAVESNCPWECDDGYGRVGDACQPLCTAGVTRIRAGTATVPLWAARHTTPTLVVRTTGGVCYGNLTPGAGTGLSILYNDQPYHTVQ